MWKFDAQRVLLNARQATTEDLLDRVTVYRDGMEPEALPILEAELRSRGIGPTEIAAYEQQKEAVVVRRSDGSAARCSCCHAPAVTAGWSWYRLWRVVPLLPRYFYYCAVHTPPGLTTPPHEQPLS